MTDEPLQPSLIYLTTPSRDVAVLCVQLRQGEQPMRFAVNRDQLFSLNADTAQALIMAPHK